MSKRLQVILDDQEMDDIRRAARRREMTTAEWVREALRAASRQESRRDATKKLTAVRAAAAHAFPTADLDQMLQEIVSSASSEAR